MEHFKVKVIIVGEPGAGKTFIAKTTDICYPTKELGASIGKVSETFLETSCEMMLLTWTITEGRPKESTHLKYAEAAIIVCDLTNPETVLLVPVWADRVLNVVGEIPLFFAGNNADLGTQEDLNLLRRVADRFKSPCFPISSQDQESVRDLFKTIAHKLSDDLIGKGSEDYNTINQDNN